MRKSNLTTQTSQRMPHHILRHYNVIKSSTMGYAGSARLTDSSRTRSKFQELINPQQIVSCPLPHSFEQGSSGRIKKHNPSPDTTSHTTCVELSECTCVYFMFLLWWNNTWEQNTCTRMIDDIIFAKVIIYYLHNYISDSMMILLL